MLADTNGHAGDADVEGQQGVHAGEELEKVLAAGGKGDCAELCIHCNTWDALFRIPADNAGGVGAMGGKGLGWPIGQGDPVGADNGQPGDLALERRMLRAYPGVQMADVHRGKSVFFTLVTQATGGILI